MLREWTYTASSRDALGNTSPSALEISLGRGFCTPRPSRLPSGFALGQSLGPRGAKSPPLGNLLGLGECIFQYIPPLGSVRIQYTSQQPCLCLLTSEFYFKFHQEQGKEVKLLSSSPKKKQFGSSIFSLLKLLRLCWGAEA